LRSNAANPEVNKILKNIHWLFWTLAFFSLIYGVYVHINLADLALDIFIDDTMLVISTAYVLAFQSGVFFMFGLAYYLFYNKEIYKPVDSLSIIHIVLTVFGLSILFFMSKFLNRMPLDSAGDIYETLRMNRVKSNIKEFSGLGVFGAQILFLVNLFVSIFRK